MGKKLQIELKQEHILFCCTGNKWGSCKFRNRSSIYAYTTKCICMSESENYTENWEQIRNRMSSSSDIFIGVY